MTRRWLFATVVLLAADVAGAHLLLRMRPDLDMPRAERVRLARLE